MIVVKFIAGAVAIVVGLAFAASFPVMFGAACLAVAIFAGLNDYKNKP